MVNKSGIIRRVIKNGRRARGDVQGVITAVLSSCVNMPVGANTVYDIDDLSAGMVRAVIMDAAVSGSANGA